MAKLAPTGAPALSLMSESIKHECGVAYVRLRKPLSYYQTKYGDPLWGLKKLFFLLQKQRNRGHDGVGFACCKLKVRLGEPYMFWDRSAKRDALGPVFRGILKKYKELKKDGVVDKHDPDSIQQHFHFGGENLFGHLRYATSGAGSKAKFCHPQVHNSTWKTKSLMLIGNFNMTNVGQLKAAMINRGQHPFQDIDTQVVLEDLAFHLEEEHDRIYKSHIDDLPKHKIPDAISQELDFKEVIQTATSHWDGGYVIAGAVGNGDGFVMRDPHGIRPCFYFENDEVIAFASERPPLMTVFNQPIEEVHELPAGTIASIKNRLDSPLEFTSIAAGVTPRPCSFERIYFSRGIDADIYRERKLLGGALVDQVLKQIDNFDDAIFTFIPNTAEMGYLGMMDELRVRRRQEVKDRLAKAIANGNADEQLLERLIGEGWPRGEKLAHKDEKFRTFISNEKGRKEMVSLGYDITYGQVGKGHTLVALDDSIVRGTTLKESLIGILGRLNPGKIVIVSTAPQIRYPDCYGIDMSELGKFLAFNSAIELLLRDGKEDIIAETYEKCKWGLKTRTADQENFVKAIYKPYTLKELSEEMARQVLPDEEGWDKEVVLVFQKIENLHKALDDGKDIKYGDWYFTGNYPTPGGIRVVNKAFVSFIEGSNGRPYDEWQSGAAKD